MFHGDLTLYETDHRKIMTVIDRLYDSTSARLIVLLDKSGQEIAVKGDTTGFDTTSLASLTAGNVAATDGLAKLVGEREFTILFHEGERDNIHISMVGQRMILVVIFDQQSSLGLVRLRVRRATVQLEEVLEEMFRSEGGDDDPAVSEISDDDINRLFGE